MWSQSMIHKSIAIVSLMLAVMTLTISIKGHNGYVRIYDTGWDPDRTHVCCFNGSLEFEYEPAGTPQYCSSPNLAPAWWWRVSGKFGTLIRFPMWVPLILFSIIPVWALIGIPLRARRRRDCNQCIHCGYNLTGLPEPRCPECGETT